MKHISTKNKNPDQKWKYIIHIKEQLLPNWSDGYEEFMVTCSTTGETYLSGLLPDQAALHGLLTRIRDQNLTLISVNRIEAEKSLASPVKPGNSMQIE